jgi:hypothetical protein
MGDLMTLARTAAFTAALLTVLPAAAQAPRNDGAQALYGLTDGKCVNFQTGKTVASSSRSQPAANQSLIRQTR